MWATEPGGFWTIFFERQTRRGRVGTGLSAHLILAKSVLKYTPPQRLHSSHILDYGEVIKGKKTLFAFHPGAPAGGYLCQILS